MKIEKLDAGPFEKLYNRIVRTERAAVTIPVHMTTVGSQFLYMQILKNLSGVPGMPQPNTRGYMRSWRIMQIRIGPTAALSQVTTFHPAGARLEHGFQGVDSLGRQISQPARPHVAPAVKKTQEFFHQEMVTQNVRIWRQR